MILLFRLAPANSVAAVKWSQFRAGCSVIPPRSPVNMPITEDQLKSKLIKELDASHVEVVDESDGCGGKFSCIIVSAKFQGKPLLQRHRLVNTVLQDELKNIHAFSQKTLTPEQWKEQQQQ